MRDIAIDYTIIAALVAIGHFFPMEMVIALLALHTVRSAPL